MKLTKKKVLVAALCVCLIAILSMGSLAWFTASDDITNNFYVGTTEDDDSGKDVFGIDVWETDDTGAKDDDGLEYTEILPGDVLHKDPTFTNTGVHPQFVRATVTVSDADIFMEVLGNDYADPNVLFKGIIPNDWTFDGVSYVGGELKYVFYYNHVLAAKADTSALFTDVEIPLAMTLQQAQALTGDAFSVNIYGEAIQSENLGVNTAKEAFVQYQPEDLTYGGAATIYLENKNISGEEIAYITAPGEVRLVNATVDTETGLAVENGQNSTLMIVGGTYDVANGPVVSADSASSPVVLYLFGPVTVNGTVINSQAEAEASGAFENVTIIWMGNTSSYFN
jgi:predicted ribosomally synthesized peptide with SipW-like signal peptide